VIPRSLAGDDHVPGPRIDDGRRRILLVDDDETFRYVFRQMLKGDARYEIVDAIDGTEGLRLARAERPDLIILDLQMPRLDGFGLLQELAADPELARLPVVISTSLSVTAELQARLPPGMAILSKQDISRDSLARALQDLVDDRLAS
jgi:CheY-like chemotaxis protein